MKKRMQSGGETGGNQVSPRKQLAMGRTPPGLPATPSKPKFAKGGMAECPPMEKYGMGYRKSGRKA